MLVLLLINEEFANIFSIIIVVVANLDQLAVMFFHVSNKKDGGDFANFDIIKGLSKKS